MLSKTQRRAIVLELMAKYKTELKLLHVHLMTGSRVVIKFAGVYEEFLFQNGDVSRTENGTSLDPGDARTLFALAKNVRAAIVASYKDSRKKRQNKVTPKPVSNNKKSRSHKNLEAARATHLYQQYADHSESAYFNVQLASGDMADIRIGNYTHHFEYLRKYDVARLVPGSARMNREDFCFTCTFSKSLMTAAVRGYRSTQARRKSEPQVHRQLEMTLLPPVCK